MKLSEWLSRNSGPYEVCLFTVKPGTSPAEHTAGRVAVLVDRAEARDDGAVIFVQRVAGEDAGDIVLFEGAMADGAPMADGGFAAGYANLTVPLEDFLPNVVVTVRKALQTERGSIDA